MRLWLLVILLLAALLAVSGGAWRLDGFLRDQGHHLERLDTQVQELHREADLSRGRQATLTQDNQALRDRLANLDLRLQAASRELAEVDQIARPGNQRLQLEVIEQLLLLANERAQLAADGSGALAALQAANVRLGELNDPSLLPIRQTLTREITALQGIPQADISGDSLLLSGYIDACSSWPLQNSPHVQSARSAASAQAAPPAPQSWGSRGLQAIREALFALVRVRRIDHPIEPLLSAEDQNLVAVVLQLRLETARSALLQRDTGTFRAALMQTRSWIDHYYRRDDTRVAAAESSLQQMQAQALRPALPDLSQGLAQLRGRLAQNGTP